MPVIEGKKAVEWIEVYVRKKEPKVAAVAKGLRALMKKTAAENKDGIKENPWRIPTFEVEGPMSFFMVGKKTDVWIFARGIVEGSGGIALEGTGKSLRHVKLRKWRI